MSRVCLLLVLILTLCLPSIARADIASAIAAYQREDYATAYRESSKLAQQGDAIAQYILGLMYDAGQGVPRDYARAVKWYRAAAEQGHAGAQNNLGRMYDKGFGVPQDRLQAAKWYRAAAEQGVAVAQYNLGLMYDKGLGVPKEYVQAYAWFTLAAAQGDKTARTMRDTVSARMTPVQIAEARRISSSFKPKFGRPTQARLDKTPLRPEVATGAGAELTAKVQHKLRALGYDPGPADGMARPVTGAAVREFQHDHGIEPDGVISARLLALLQAAAQPAAPKKAPSCPNARRDSHGFLCRPARRLDH